MKYSIGIDIGGTNTVLGLVNSQGSILQTNKISTTAYNDFDAYMEAICLNILDLCKQKNIEEILGVGIGAPNGNYYRGVIDRAPNLKYKGVLEVKRVLEEKLRQHNASLEVRLDNDANAAAMGEKIYGKARGVKNFIMITLGTGLGSGVVVEDKLVYGHTGFAGEVGHTIIEENGRLCNCGRKGCVERYCSVSGFTLTAKEKLKGSSQPSILRNYNEEEITGALIYESALKGDELALSCYDYTAKMLAIALANATAITSPEKIFIFGGLSKSGNLLLDPLKEYFETYLFDVFKGSVSIELSGLKDDSAAILGAAALMF
ncbi:MAG: ROK family protein [Bacteroidota bacterium]|nr:ROK family protein [Bacteroidota bacterium]